jgi:hypothetical protein
LALVAGAVVVALLNGLLLFQYQLFLKGWRDIAPYPDSPWRLWIERFLVPMRVLARCSADDARLRGVGVTCSAA